MKRLPAGCCAASNSGTRYLTAEPSRHWQRAPLRMPGRTLRTAMRTELRTSSLVLLGTCWIWIHVNQFTDDAGPVELPSRVVAEVRVWKVFGVHRAIFVDPANLNVGPATGGVSCTVILEFNGAQDGLSVWEILLHPSLSPPVVFGVLVLFGHAACLASSIALGLEDMRIRRCSSVSAPIQLSTVSRLRTRYTKQLCTRLTRWMRSTTCFSMSLFHGTSSRIM